MTLTALGKRSRKTALWISVSLLSVFLFITVVLQFTVAPQSPATSSPSIETDALSKPRVDALFPRLLAQPQKLSTLEGQTSYPSAASFSHDGQRVLTGSSDKTARVWDADPSSKTYGKLLRTLEGHTEPVFAASFSPDGRRVVTGSHDNTARLWDADPNSKTYGQLLRTLEGHTEWVYAASFSPDGRRVVTGSRDNTARPWDTDPGSKTYGKHLRTLKGHTYTVLVASFSPDGRRILTASNDSTARLWDADSQSATFGQELPRIDVGKATVLAASFSPDSRWLLTAPGDNTARLWDADPNSKTYGKLLRTLKGHTGWVRAASFSLDGRWMLTGADDGTARLWDADSQSATFGSEVSRFDAGQPITAAAFSTDGRRVVLGAGTWDPDPAKSRGEVQIWQVARAQDQASAVETPQLVTNSIGTKMRLIPAGSFLRGATLNDTQSSDHEKPQRKVSITKPYYLGIYEVTQFEYRQLIGDNPSKFKGSESLPVEQVTWFDAIKFCNKLSERELRRLYYKFEGSKVTILGGNGYRLPTEAEWEYACRAPESPVTATKHPFGNSDDDLESYAWFGQNSDWKTHPVGQKKPNRWGLYDMQGNVWEWCQDWYSSTYYKSGPESDPQGPDPTSHRVSRGGGWNFNPNDCRPASRLKDEPGTRFNNLGFRLAADQ